MVALQQPMVDLHIHHHSHGLHWQNNPVPLRQIQHYPIQHPTMVALQQAISQLFGLLKQLIRKHVLFSDGDT